MSASEIDSLLVERIRAGASDAWSDLIQRYEGRLLAFVESRVGDRAAAEDIVQETLIGFLNSLPNYDGERSLESYLFAICAYKLTDALRRRGRRPTLPLSGNNAESTGDWEPAGIARAASSIARSGERKNLESQIVAQGLRQMIAGWREKEDWNKIKLAELLFVRGLPNKDAAVLLTMSEQQVANFKFDFLARLRNLIRKQSASPDVFPELYESS